MARDPKETSAMEYAIAKHGDQKYGNEPYSFHLTRVRDIVEEFTRPSIVLLQAAWLHDVLEDTNATVQDLNAKFGDEVANLVWAVTGVGSSRTLRMDSVYRKIGYTKNLDAAFLKCCDRLANVRASVKPVNIKKLELYVREWPAFYTNVVSRIDARYSHLADTLVEILGDPRV